MFEQVGERRRGVWWILGLAVAGGAAFLWWRDAASPPPPPSEPTPTPVPVARPAATPASVRESIERVLAANPGGELWHVDCDPLPCLGSLRIPLPETDGAWRYRTETALLAEGWVLSPAGRVDVLGERVMQGGVMPRRALYTLALRDEDAPISDETKEEIKDRMQTLAREGAMAVGAW
jgi:hypothetical protein